MTPNFALLLSSDGIVLLQRVAEGWVRAGAAALDAEDLNAEMAALRQTASDLADDALRTLLILPEDQIKFLSIDTARTSQDDIEKAVAEATPMQLDEIRFDFDRSGGRTYIAAVAKQTLLEAETFAQEHGFAPLALTALAEPYTFRHAVNFGLTAYAQETWADIAEQAQEDAEALRNALRERSVDIAPVAEDTPEPDVDPDDISTVEELPVFVSRSRSDKSQTPAPVAVEADTQPVPQFRRSRTARPERKPRAPVAAPPRQPAPPTKEPAFAAIATAKRPSAPLALPGDLSNTEQRRVPVAAMVAVGALALVGGFGVWAARSLDTNVAGLFTQDPGLQEDAPAPAPVVVAEPTPAPSTSQPEAAPNDVTTEIATAPATPTPDPVATPTTPIVTAIPGRVLSPADAARVYAATGVWQRAPRLPERDVNAQGTLEGIHSFAVLPDVVAAPNPSEPDLPSSLPDLRIIAPLNPAPLNQPRPRDEDGFIVASAVGTVLPTGVPIFGRAPSLRPPLRPTDERIYLRDDSIPDVQFDVVTGIELVSYTVDSASPTVSAFASPTLSQPLPVISPEQTAPQALADDISAVTATADPLPPEPAPEIMDQFVSDVAEPTGPTPEELVGTSFADPSQPDLGLLRSTPTRAVSGAPDAAVTPPPLDNADAPQGVVNVIAGRPEIEPPLRPTDPAFGVVPVGEAPVIQDRTVASLAGPGDSPDTGALSVTTDRSVAQVAPSPVTAPTADQTFGASSPVAVAEAEPEQTAPAEPEEAVIIIAGAPSVVPPLRPEAVEQAAAPDVPATEPALADAVAAALATATAEQSLYQDPALAGPRPLIRPASLLPASARTFEAIPALADARPLLRPAGIAPEPEPEAVVAEAATATPDDIASIVASIASAAPPSLIVAPTQRAIVLSPRPDTRPQNFARVVAAAQAITARQQPAASTPTQTAAIVQTPAPQSAPVTGGQSGVTVARAATVDNAIRLRDMNLIGVYGKPGARRALVRMPNGRFVKVEVGSSLDGGRVTAINDSALNFVKRGRTYALQLPAG